jgi:hypothetical protein
MKKLFTLAFAVMLSTSMVMAQSNDATVSQTGNGSEATVVQAGSSHEAVVTQSSSFGTGHTAEVTQNGGDGNSANVLQDQANAEAYVVQTGSDNVAASKQSGYNVLNLDQVGDRNVLQGRTAGSRAFQKNGVGIFASDANYLNVVQTGDDNVAGVWQEHHAEGEILQTGDRNRADLYQTGAPGGAINSASITQSGNDHVASIRQIGDGNDATISQTLSIHAGLATIVQEGRRQQGITGSERKPVPGW